MHDTFLLKHISESLTELCDDNHIAHITLLEVLTSPGSHMHSENLHEHLEELHPELIGDWTTVKVDSREDMEDLTAVIESIEGDILDS